MHQRLPSHLRKVCKIAKGEELTPLQQKHVIPWRFDRLRGAWSANNPLFVTLFLDSPFQESYRGRLEFDLVAVICFTGRADRTFILYVGSDHSIHPSIDLFVSASVAMRNQVQPSLSNKGS